MDGGPSVGERCGVAGVWAEFDPTRGVWCSGGPGYGLSAGAGAGACVMPVGNFARRQHCCSGVGGGVRRRGVAGVVGVIEAKTLV